MAFEDACLKSSLVLPSTTVDQVGYQLGGLVLGVGPPAFAIGTVAAGATVFAVDFAAPARLGPSPMEDST